MCKILDNIPADVWAEIEAIANDPRYAEDAPQESINNQTASLWEWEHPTTSAEDKNQQEGR